MPKFSIIVPIYNVEKYLNRCIDSILAQTYEDFELILVDDGSPDNCPKICDDYQKKDSRIKVIHKENQGVSAARNTGLEKSTGEYAWFVDSDDCINPFSLQKLCEYTEKKYDIIRFGHIWFTHNQEPNFINLTKYFFPHFNGVATKKDIDNLLTKACSTIILPYAWKNIYKLSFLKSNNILFAPKLGYGEDSVFNMKAYLLAENIFFSQEPLYAYYGRDDGASQIVTENFDENLLQQLTVYDSLRDEYYEKYCEHKSDEYYKDAGIFIAKSRYIYTLLGKLSKSRQKNSFWLFRKISSSPLVRKAFSRFNIKELKSKSLDYYMMYFVSKKMYFSAYLIYRFFLF